IDRYTETGLALRSGRQLDADIVVTATGLRLQFFGGASVEIDGRPVNLASTKVYKGAMLSGVPNWPFAAGYTNASWRFKTELIARYVCRLVNHLDASGYRSCIPTPGPDVGDEPLLDFTSGYVQRALPDLPRQGSKVPWKLYQSYFRDIVLL